MTRPRLLTVPLAFLALMSLGASCSGGTGETTTGNEGRQPEEGPRVERLDQVDVSQLTRSEQRVWVELINELLSPCGEPITVGRCVAEERECRRCVPGARYLVRLIGEGYERQEVEELYNARFGREEPAQLTVEGAPTRGSPMAQITIVEFSDFECPYCGRAHSILGQVLNEFEGRVRLVFKHYPLGGHPRAMPAARAAIAAGNQGKFWEMHDLLFEHQRQLEDEDLESYAQQLGLDLERFRRDMMSAETQRRIEADKAEGQRAGVEGTPTFYINGRRFREPPSALPAYLREELDQ
jgi:2-hydroxychromene-2-carboxylate isomerase